MSGRTVTEPVTVNDGRDGTITTHPSYGQISASRRQGGGFTLYGSDFVHNSTVAITISASELHRSLSRDWNFPRHEIIEVVLSESQWATFVSSLNNGSGPCCTIQHVQGERMPCLPAPQERTKQYSGEYLETINDALKRIDMAIENVSASGLSAKKSLGIVNDLKMAKQELLSNIPFIAKSFDESMEETVEKAKQEIHGYLTGHIARAGLEALQSSRDVPSLESSDAPMTPTPKERTP